MPNKKIIISFLDGNGSSSESVLSKLEASNAMINSSCRSGFCGDCAMTLVEGETEYFSDPLGYCHEGQILTCISRLKTNSISLK